MNHSKKIAIILSGCGFKDGSEIHESVLTMLAIDQQGAAYSCFAPDIPQKRVYDHYHKIDSQKQRNVLVESARIARGDIQPLSKFDAADFDAVVFPGGFGASSSLSSFAQDGVGCNVNNQVEKVILDMHQKRKPIGALCISPIIIAKLIANSKITIGNAPGVADAITKMGAIHENTGQGQIAIDNDNKIVTTPCYMLNSTISQVFVGVEKLVSELLKMA
ncbi:MAG: isoprenoid biosynthesis protein ElbB [Gammaproteobacteria bacterium]|nr:MAG: isoprenoid biosynthesis protein ElbB [Gammaproteobacteria bacterium]